MIAEDQVEKMVTTKDKGTRLCILTSWYYDSSLAYFQFLFNIAQRDFPEIELKDCNIRHYTGRFRKGHGGLEFEVKTKTMPDGYKEMSDYTICTMFPT